MGNPKRWFFDNKCIIKPDLSQGTNKLKIVTYDENFEFKDYYDVVFVDFYSAPDVIYHYSNGNTCKDEWRRYDRWRFEGLKLLDKLESDDVRTILFEFAEFNSIWDESIKETDIPLGKFRGMTQKEVDEYQRKNFVKFKDWKPQPSLEAIQAASEVIPELDRTDIENILVAAYRVDL